MESSLEQESGSCETTLCLQYVVLGRETTCTELLLQQISSIKVFTPTVNYILLCVYKK